MSNQGTSKTLSPHAPSFIPMKFLHYPPPPPVILLPDTYPLQPTMHLHANVNFFHQENFHLSPLKHLDNPSSPTPARQRLGGKFRRGRRGWGASHDEQVGGTCLSFGSSSSSFGGDSGPTELTPTTRYPRIVNSSNKYNRCWNSRECRRLTKPVVPVCEDGVNTTVMIRNIPNKYT